MATVSSGSVYDQLSCEPTFEQPPDGANVCAYPARDELRVLSSYAADNGLRVVSIGCGEGYLEGLLERDGVHVCGLRALRSNGRRLGSCWTRYLKGYSANSALAILVYTHIHLQSIN